jgi:acyl-CoA synthetase (AMP-forming)/AMP-acid ligase II
VQPIYYDEHFIANLSDSEPIPEELRKNKAPDSVTSLLYTSGSTGLPKAVIMITAREILVAHSVSRYLRLTKSDRFYTCMPLYHGAAHGLCLTPSIQAGCTVVLGRKFSHKRFWPEVRESKANIIQYVGELCRYLINAPEHPQDKDHNVQVAWGNGMRPDVWERFRDRFGIPVINELYAATDGLGSAFNENKGEFTKFAIGKRGLLWRMLKSKGEVLVKIDPDTEEILRDDNGFAIRCKLGEPGEVITQIDPENPDAAFHGYWKNKAAGDKRKIRDVFKKGDL